MEGHRLRPQSIWRTYLGLLGSPLLMVMIVASLAIGAVNVLGAVRAYVAGESMWAKARAEAVHHLVRYARTHEPGDLNRFHQALRVPESDRLAREAMERHDPDTARIARWLIDGRNHPDDVPNMIRLFRWFGDRWVLQDARQTWADADALIAALKQEADRLENLIGTNAPLGDIEAQVQRISELNVELNQAGIRFTEVLGQAARVTEGLLIAGLICVALLLSVVSILQVRQVLRKQARHQQAIDAIHGRWELASKAAGFGLYEMDQVTDEITLDDKAAAMHGLPAQACVVPRAQIRQLIVTDDAIRTRQDTDTALNSGLDFRIVYRVRHPNGQVRALEATGRLVHPPHGGNPRLTGVLRDITVELEQVELAMKRDAAERVAQSQREFLSRLSHELRTPLNAILGFAQLMQLDQANATATQNRQVGMILGAGKQLLSLVEDVLDLSKVESGHIHMHLDAVDAHAAIHACVPLLDTHLSKDNLRLQLELSDGPLWVHADLQRLHQVLINLLTNACKYNREGGQVSVRTYRSTTRPSHVCIDICDTGKGLTPAQQNELFQPFKRVNPSPQVEGTGLGLYIVKLLIERMGGEVRLRSEVGKGSTFTIELPDSPPPAQPEASPGSQTFV